MNSTIGDGNNTCGGSSFSYAMNLAKMGNKTGKHVETEAWFPIMACQTGTCHRRKSCCCHLRAKGCMYDQEIYGCGAPPYDIKDGSDQPQLPFPQKKGWWSQLSYVFGMGKWVSQLRSSQDHDKEAQIILWQTPICVKQPNDSWKSMVSRLESWNLMKFCNRLSFSNAKFGHSHGGRT